MLDHLTRAFVSFPLFGLVGLRSRRVRPVAIEDMALILAAALVDGRFSRQTMWVTGPEELTLADAVRRVAKAVGHTPLFVRMPLCVHYALAWILERTMKVPLVALAQVRILAEGLVEPSPGASAVPPDLAPRTRFTVAQISRGLPEPVRFGLQDLALCCGTDRRR